MTLDFKRNETPLTLGVELEFQVLDQQSRQLTPRSKELIELAHTPKIIPEFFQSTIEITSGVCANAFEASDDLAQSVRILKSTGQSLALGFASTGTHPQANYRDRLITQDVRYNQLIDRNQWLIRRMAVYGMHIHLGMKSGDDCIRFHNFFLYFVPHLIALSASSPYWQKMDTGLAACRPTMYEALPTAGMPYIVKTWSEFETLIRFLKRSDAIQSLKDLWWDIRPSPTLGTLEIRVCDGPASHQEMQSIVAFVHVLALWFQDHTQDWVKTHAPIKRWIFRENKWRAIRYGLEASIITTRTGKTLSLCKDLGDWLAELQPYIAAQGYQDIIKLIPTIMEKGNSAQRQRKVFSMKNDLDAVVSHNMQEFELGQPIWTQ